MNENIQSKLAINIAQLSLEKAVSEARSDELQETLNSTLAQLETDKQRIEQLEKEKTELEAVIAEFKQTNKKEVNK